ncbi:MAG: CotH kinase family protein [Bacteroidales bacterium]
MGENLNVSLLGMPAENDWILYGPYSDKSMLRNFMAFYIGSLLDPYCSRIAYCEVIENNNYKGVYILMEKIKKDENRVNIATLKSEDISGDELTGGYILRVDKLDPDFAYGYHGWKSIPNPPYPNALNITYQYYYPKAEDIMPQQKSYITDYILNAENALTGNGFNNPNTGYNHFLNVGSFVDHMVLREISKEVDSYRYSTYFYKEKDSDGGKLFAGPPWDFNLGFANVDYYEPGVETSGWIFTEVEPWDAGRMFWWKRLMQDPYYENLFYTRWHQLRQDELTDENIELAIDSIVNYIGEAQQRNFSRWPILGQYVWPNYSWEGNDYEDEVALFEDWLMDRIYWLDSNIPGTMLSPSALLSGTFPELNISLTDDYFSREILKNKYFDLNISSDEVSLDTVIFEDASHAKLFFMGNPDPNTLLSVTIDKKVINTFSDLSTNEIALTGLESITANKFRIYASGKKIIIENTDRAEDDYQLSIFSATGQKTETFRLSNKDVQCVETKQNKVFTFVHSIRSCFLFV